MNIMWPKTEMEQKSDRERRRDEGGGGGEQKERVLSFGIWIHEKNFLVCVDLTLEKEKGFQFQTSQAQGMNGKTGVPGEKTH